MADSIPAHLALARSQIGKYQDGPSILPLAAKIGELYPEMAGYCRLVVPTTSWCGLFCGHDLAVNGIRPPYNPKVDTQSFLWARAWLNYGTPVQRGQEQPGDILVFDFGGGDSHVTFHNGDSGSNYLCLGGNQSNQVSVSPYPKSQCIGIRRPPAPSSQPQPLPPTTSGGTLARSTIDQIVSLARNSALARHSWSHRGMAPIGYINGLAVTFARVYLKLKAGDSTALAMTAPLVERARMRWRGMVRRPATVRPRCGNCSRCSTGWACENPPATVSRGAIGLPATSARTRRKLDCSSKVGIRAAQAPSCPSYSRRIRPIRTDSCRSSAKAFQDQLRRTKEAAMALRFRRSASPAPHLRWKRPRSACALSVGTGDRSIVAKRRFVRRPRHCCCRCRR